MNRRCLRRAGIGLLATLSVRLGAAGLDLPPEAFLAAEKARMGGELTPAETDLLARNRDTLTQLAVLGLVNDKTFQSGNAAATGQVVRNADAASAAAGGRMAVQAAGPGKTGGVDPGGDVDTINRNFISPLQVTIAQRAFNDRMNQGLPEGQQRDNWQKKLDVDFMAHPSGIKDKDFKIVAALNNDAYKSRAAADYEALSRDPKKPYIPPAVTAAYVQEMKDFADKKAGQIEKARAELAGNPGDRGAQAKLAILEGQQMKYINRIATATDRALQDKGREPVSSGIARAADLGSRRGPTPTATQAEALGKQGADFQEERAKVRAKAPDLLAKAMDNFEKNKAAMGIPNTPPPLKGEGSPPTFIRDKDGLVHSSTVQIRDGEGRKLVEKSTTSHDGKGNYLGTRTTVTTPDPGSKPLPDQRFGGKVQDMVNRNVQESRTEVERIRGSQKDAGMFGVGQTAVVQQDKTSITRTDFSGLAGLVRGNRTGEAAGGTGKGPAANPLELTGSSQKSTTRETYMTGGEKPFEVSTTRSSTRSSGFSYESEKKQGSVTWEYGDRREVGYSKEIQRHDAPSQPENKTNWKVPGLNVKLFERSVTNVNVAGKSLLDHDGVLGRTRIKAGNIKSVWTLSGTADPRNARLDAGYAGSVNLLDVSHNVGKQALSPGQSAGLNPYASLSGTLGAEARAGLSVSGGEDGAKADLSASAYAGGKARAEAGFTLDARNSYVPVSIGYRGSIEARAGLGGEASAGVQLGWGSVKFSGKLAGAVGLGGGMSHSVDVDVSKLTLGVDLTAVAEQEAKAMVLDRYRQGLARGDLVLQPGQTQKDLLASVNKAVENTLRNGAPLPSMEEFGVSPQNPAVVLNQLKTRAPADSEEAKILAKLDADLRSNDPQRQKFAADALRDIRAADQYGISMPVSTGYVFADGGGNLRVDPRTGKSGPAREQDDLDNLMKQTRPGSDEASMLDKLAVTLRHGTPAEQFAAREKLEILKGIAHDDPRWARPAEANPFQDAHDADDRARLERLKADAKPGSPEMDRLLAIEAKLASPDRDQRNSAWAELNQAQREREDGPGSSDPAAAAAEAGAKRDAAALLEAARLSPPGSVEARAVAILEDRLRNGTPEQREKAREQLGRLLEAQREHAGIRAAVAEAGPDLPAAAVEEPPPPPAPRWSEQQLASHNERMENLGAGYMNELDALEAARRQARSPDERARLDAAIAKKKADLAWVTGQIAENNAILEKEFGVKPPPPTREDLQKEQARLAAEAEARAAAEAKLGSKAMKTHDPARVLDMFAGIDSNRAARARAQTQAVSIGQALSGEPPPAPPAGPSRWTNEGLDNDIWNMRNLQGHTREDIQRLREQFANSRNSTERKELLQALADKQAEWDALQDRIRQDLEEKERNRLAGLGGGADWSQGPGDGDGAGTADVAGANGLIGDITAGLSGGGAGTGDEGGAVVAGGTVGGDVAGATRTTRSGFTSRDGAHKGDKEAGMETGEANPLGDLSRTTDAIGGAVAGVRDGVEGVRDVRRQVDELRGSDKDEPDSGHPPPPPAQGGGDDSGDGADASGGESHPHKPGVTRKGEPGKGPPGGAGPKRPPVIQDPDVVRPSGPVPVGPGPATPPSQTPPAALGPSGYAVFLMGRGNNPFLGAGEMSNYYSRSANLAAQGKPMDWTIEASGFSSRAEGLQWIQDNTTPGDGPDGYGYTSRTYKGKTVRAAGQ